MILQNGKSIDLELDLEEHLLQEMLVHEQKTNLEIPNRDCNQDANMKNHCSSH